MMNDSPHEECGIIGIFAPNEDVARMAFFGLFALQHRGQEAAGIAVSDGAYGTPAQGSWPGCAGLHPAKPGSRCKGIMRSATRATPQQVLLRPATPSHF